MHEAVNDESETLTKSALTVQLLASEPHTDGRLHVQECVGSENWTRWIQIKKERHKGRWMHNERGFDQGRLKNWGESGQDM